MASPNPQHGHLDATTSREAVYCHACANEWYRDEHGLICPDCESDVTEIISPENDPRQLDHHSSASTSPEITPFRLHDDDISDPEEADIEEHLGPHGFHYRQSTRDGGLGQRHHDPGIDPVMERFLNMVQGFAPPRRTTGPSMFRHEGHRGPGQPQVHRATFMSGNASVTIFSAPAPAPAPAPAHHDEGAGAPPADPFQSIFASILRDMAPPDAPEQGGPTPLFARGLQEILGLFNPANAVAGDAVYSQEALDQIITNLMEAHPQSNAAPPATTEALANLDRRPVEQAMLEGEAKTECAICIDDMNVGDMAAFLPCKHWFHEACVVLWLNEHNTCPVCRSPIEGNGGRSQSRPNVNVNLNENNNRSPSFNDGSPLSARSNAWPIPGARPSQSRPNEPLRSISQMQQERDRERGSTSGFSYDTSRLQRRNSLSPTSPRDTAQSVYGARMRQRSPSQSSRRGYGDGDSSQQTNSFDPIGWLRGRFSGNGGSNQDSSRDGR